MFAGLTTSWLKKYGWVVKSFELKIEVVWVDKKGKTTWFIRFIIAERFFFVTLHQKQLRRKWRIKVISLSYGQHTANWSVISKLLNLLRKLSSLWIFIFLTVTQRICWTIILSKNWIEFHINTIHAKFVTVSKI